MAEFPILERGRRRLIGYQILDSGGVTAIYERQATVVAKGGRSLLVDLVEYVVFHETSRLLELAYCARALDERMRRALEEAGHG